MHNSGRWYAHRQWFQNWVKQAIVWGLKQAILWTSLVSLDANEALACSAVLSTWRLRDEELTSAGLHHTIRQVAGVSSPYFMAAEYLSCKWGKKKVISWSKNIARQLDIGHRVQFPCLLAGGEADVAIALPCKRFCLGVTEIWSPHSITTACVDFHIAVTLLPIAKMKRKYKKTRQNVVLITLSHTVPSSDDLFSSALWTTVLCLQRPKMKWALITFEG